MGITNVAIFNSFRINNVFLAELIKREPSLRLMFNVESLFGLWEKLKTCEPIPDIIVVCFNEYSLVANSAINMLTKKFSSIRILLGDYTGGFHSSHKANRYCFFPGTSHEEVVDLIKEIHSRCFYHSINGDFTSQKNNYFTLRQLEVYEQLLAGKGNAEIADVLNLTVKALEFHKNNLFKKTNCNSSVELVSFAYKNKLAT